MIETSWRATSGRDSASGSRRVPVRQRLSRVSLALTGCVLLLLVGTRLVAAPSLPGPSGQRHEPLPFPSAGSGLATSELFARLPLSFEPNVGQADASVRFLARTPGYTLLLTSDEAIMVLDKGAAGGSGRRAGAETRERTIELLRTRLVGSRVAQPLGLERQPGESNYFVGDSATRWRTGVPHFARVRYEGVYPGIDLIYYGNGRVLEYDFVVQPGGDPTAIRLSFAGARALRVDERGDLVVQMAGGDVSVHAPVVYQTIGGSRREVAGRFELHGTAEVSFTVGAYDRQAALVIDPVVEYSTYLGGTSYDTAMAAAFDSVGSAYITGSTESTNFLLQNYYQTDQPFRDVFVTKLAADGASCLYSTYIGGGGYDYGYAIAVDASGAAYVAGQTSSTNFPTVSPIQGSHAGVGDAFTLRLAASGAALDYSTYLGGSNQDTALALVLDGSGDVILGGYTLSTNFPTLVPLQVDPADSARDMFVTKLDPDVPALVFSTYLGGNAADGLGGLAVDGDGSIYVCGSSESTDYPLVNPFQGRQGDSDAVVSKLSADGQSLLYSTYLGGTAYDVAHDVAVDTAGSAYVVGVTYSQDFPLRLPLRGDSQGNEAFVTKLAASGASLVYSTYFGGSNEERLSRVAVNAAGNAYAVGNSSSSDLPLRNPAYGYVVDDAILVKLSTAGDSLVYSSYLGGSASDYAYDVALGAGGRVLVVGGTYSSNFPTVSNLRPYLGNGDAFITSLNETADLSLAMAAAPDPVSVGGVISYTLTAHNAGPAAAGDVKVIDTLPPGLTFVSGSAGCTAAGQVVTCVAPTLASGADLVLTIQVGVGPGAVPAVTNQALVRCEQPDPTLPNEAAVTTTVTGAAAVRLSISIASTNGGSGQAIVSPPGAVCQNPAGQPALCEYWLAPGSEVTLTTGVPADSVFVGWGGACAGTGPCTLTLSADTAVTAEFLGLADLDLQVTSVVRNYDAGGSGQVSVSPPGATCANTPQGMLHCRYWYAAGTEVTLTPTPAAGSEFAGWTGACSGMGSCLVSMAGDRNVTAAFRLTPRLNVMVGSLDNGSGQIVTIPAPGGTCENTPPDSASCEYLFETGTEVTLTATAAADSVFLGWDPGGPCEGLGTAPCTFTVAENTMASGIFQGPQRVNVMVGSLDNGSGQIVATPAGGTCANTPPDANGCTYYFRIGTEVTLTWTAAADSVFLGWDPGGPCDGLGTAPTCTFTVAAGTVFAGGIFQGPQRVNVMVGSLDNGSGQIVATPAGGTCANTPPDANGCTYYFRIGTEVTLTWTAAADSVFLGWDPGGPCDGLGTAPTCTFTVAAGTVFAGGIFQGPQRVNVMVGSLDNGSGQIVATPAGGTCANTPPDANGCSYYFRIGTEVTLTWTAAADSVFLGWDPGGPCDGLGTAPTCTFTVAAGTVFAGGIFQGPQRVNVMVGSLDNGSGQIVATPAGGTCANTPPDPNGCSYYFRIGTEVTLTWTAATDSVFLGWDPGGPCDGLGTAPTCTFSVAAGTVFAGGIFGGGADLALTKTADVEYVFPNGHVIYTLTVTNNGPATAQDVQLTDPVPPATTFVAASAGCSEAAGVVSCGWPSLAPAASEVVTIEVEAQGIAGIVNQASVSTSTFDYVASNDTAQVSTNLYVVLPGDEVLSFTGTTRAGTQLNRLEWRNPAANYESTMIRYRTAASFTACTPPEDPASGTLLVSQSLADGYDSYDHEGLAEGTVYCYSAFVYKGTGVFSPGRTVELRPFAADGSVLWGFATGDLTLAPPGIGAGMDVVSQGARNTLSSVGRGAGGGERLPAWDQSGLAAVVQHRPVSVPLSVGGASMVMLLARQDGVLEAVNAATGASLWTLGGLGALQGAPSAWLQAYGAARDLVLVGTRRDGDNTFYALDPITGPPTIAWSVTTPTPIGRINEAPTVDYASRRVYFTSLQHTTSNIATLWCVNLEDGAVPRVAWSSALGDISGAPTLRNGRVYVGNSAGVVTALRASDGVPLWSFDTNSVAPDGGVNGLVLPDRLGADLYFSTSTRVWSLSEVELPTVHGELNWSAALGATPTRPVLSIGTGRLYAGGDLGLLYELDVTDGTSRSVTLGDGGSALGSLTIDSPHGILYVGSEAGVVYAVQLPLP